MHLLELQYIGIERGIRHEWPRGTFMYAELLALHHASWYNQCIFLLDQKVLSESRTRTSIKKGGVHSSLLCQYKEASHQGGSYRANPLSHFRVLLLLIFGRIDMCVASRVWSGMSFGEG